MGDWKTGECQMQLGGLLPLLFSKPVLCSFIAQAWNGDDVLVTVKWSRVIPEPARWLRLPLVSRCTFQLAQRTLPLSQALAAAALQSFGLPQAIPPAVPSGLAVR
eukprot:TRINITY_DN11144_c1_g1_i1.p1 TRINITY_DN11144_c1_g1~~TRINITY_DN11144_c1_g1_i1.p1  ORF type:complete len:105 (+),score=5.41 TRINITY_DN11144_c1_g1_i1:173-487(+)